MKPAFALILISIGAAGTVLASPPQLLSTFVDQARAEQPGFTPSAERGRSFYMNSGGSDPDMSACAACHGSDPVQNGRHVFTGRTIKPLAPVANPARFSDIDKVEKWFRRNCNDVLERECTPAEKADFIQFLSEVSP